MTVINFQGISSGHSRASRSSQAIKNIEAGLGMGYENLIEEPYLDTTELMAFFEPINSGLHDNFHTLQSQRDELDPDLPDSSNAIDPMDHNVTNNQIDPGEGDATEIFNNGQDSVSCFFDRFDTEGSYQSDSISDYGSQFRSRDSTWGSQAANQNRSTEIGTTHIWSADTSTFDNTSASLGKTYMDSSISTSSVDSIASSTSPYIKKRRRQRYSSWKPRSTQREEIRKYQCTFCTDTFRTKYDWQRHEATIHLNLEQWECSRFGLVMQDLNGVNYCAFCRQLEPTIAHTELHNCSACLAKPREERLFRRKDHLRQHLRLFHNDCTFHSHMESWLFAIEEIQSRCGFCDANMTTWAERQKHLACHFKSGADMKDWKGNRGFDQQIEGLVENDIPAFMISDQRKTVEPFSASRSDHRFESTNLACSYGSTAVSQHEGIVDQKSYSTIYGSPEGTTENPHSHRYVERQLLNHVAEELRHLRVPSDKQLQRKMSEIMYGNDSEWDQTWADNPEWLDQFRKKAGLISLPLTGGKNAFVGNVMDEPSRE